MYKELDEIKEYLDSKDISYNTEYDNFCLNYGTPQSFEIEYVDSYQVPIANAKYGIPGVSLDYFYKQSRQAEDEHKSFKFWIKDYEWNDPRKRSIIKSYILHAAGITPTRIYARDTEVKVFTNKELKDFQHHNCFYGFRAASLNLGLVLKKEVNDIPRGTLLMVTTFGKNFFGKKDGLVEIFRVGTLKNMQVIGGSSKLINYFIKNYPTLLVNGKEMIYNKIIYYVDYDHGSGKSLDRIGFDFVKYTGGGFMNLDLETGLVSHRQPMKHKEIMQKMADGKIIAIPNAGVKVYEKNITRDMED